MRNNRLAMPNRINADGLLAPMEDATPIRQRRGGVATTAGPMPNYIFMPGL